MHSVQWTCITCGGVIFPYRTSPCRWAPCSYKKVVRTSQYRCYPILTSQGLLLESSFGHLPSRGAGTLTLSWQPSSQNPSTLYLYPKHHHRQLLLVATWHGHCSRLCVRHRRVPPSPSSRTCTLGIQDSSTVAFFAPSFPCYCAIDSSAALRRSQSFPRACAGDIMCYSVWRAEAQPLE